MPTMFDRTPNWIAATALVGLFLTASSARTQESGSSKSAARSVAMRELAQAITLVVAPSGKKSELIPEPIYRFDDPARLFSDGTIWAFGKSGRPEALLCISLEKNDRGQLKWIHELTSLSSGPVAASSRHGSGPWAWNPADPGIVLQRIPHAQPPADHEGKRLSQTRELARASRRPNRLIQLATSLPTGSNCGSFPSPPSVIEIPIPY